jgi:hypothetical protein
MKTFPQNYSHGNLMHQSVIAYQQQNVVVVVVVVVVAAVVVVVVVVVVVAAAADDDAFVAVVAVRLALACHPLMFASPPLSDS